MQKAIYSTIGKTPLVELNRLTDRGRMARVFVKLEARNPAGSVKDRPAFYMIKAAQQGGSLKPGGTIIEPTSGNTGLALAMLAAVEGHRCILVMPETMSVERRKMAKAFGAEVILTPGEDGMTGAVELANELAEDKGYFLPDQFGNINNVKAHYETTGVEILQQTPGPIAAFVAGVGTGGTITGAGRRLKEHDKKIQLIAVEPAESPLLSGGSPGPHSIQGIGANFIPKILDLTIIDQVFTVESDQALATARKLGIIEGILCGISSGANVAAALQIAAQLGPGKTVVTILPDTGERYLSTDLFAGE